MRLSGQVFPYHNYALANCSTVQQVREGEIGNVYHSNGGSPLYLNGRSDGSSDDVIHYIGAVPHNYSTVVHTVIQTEYNCMAWPVVVE